LDPDQERGFADQRQGGRTDAVRVAVMGFKAGKGLHFRLLSMPQRPYSDGKIGHQGCSGPEPLGDFATRAPPPAGPGADGRRNIFLDKISELITIWRFLAHRQIFIDHQLTSDYDFTGIPKI
jgi:hypothetical protein